MTDKEKLSEVVRLAYGMYYAAQYLTDDASRLHRAMDAYHQFIITEYNKQEPASKDIEQELEAFIKSGKAKKEENFGNFTTTHIDPLKIARHFAEWGSAHLTNKASKIEGEDLVDATNNYCLNIRKGYPRVKDETDVFICNAFKAGAQWQKEQMMKDAKDATIRMGRAANFIEKSWELDDYLQTFHSGQKVKVIIIKE